MQFVACTNSLSVHFCNVCLCFCIIWHRNYGAHGFAVKHTMDTQLVLYKPGMCFPIRYYIYPIGFNYILNIEYGFTIFCSHSVGCGISLACTFVLFACVPVLIGYRNNGACGLAPSDTVTTQLGLCGPGMCFPVGYYVYPIGFN